VTLLRALDRIQQLRAERHIVLGGFGDALALHRVQRVFDQSAIVVVLRASDRILEQHDAFRDLAGEVVLTRGDLPRQLVAPGSEHVRPRLDRVQPAADLIDLELTAPAHPVDMPVNRPQLRFSPLLAAWREVAHDRSQQIVAVAKDVDRDGHDVADAALGGIAAAVDRRRGILDQDALGDGLRSSAIVGGGGQSLDGRIVHPRRKVSAQAHRVNTR
jgi:hypothetical protein